MTSNTDHQFGTARARTATSHACFSARSRALHCYLAMTRRGAHYIAMINNMLQLLGLLVTAAGLLSPCMAETFHVAPALPATDCPKPCHTLDQYAQNRTILSNYSNITLIFLEGVHNLSYSLTVNTNLIILQPALPNQGQPPKVIGRSNNYAQFEIMIRALNVSIEGLLFEKLQLQLNENEKENYKIEGFTVTIRQCGVTGVLLNKGSTGCHQ